MPRFQAVAAQHGISETTLRRMLRAVGVEPRPRGPSPEPVPVADLIVADYRAGISAREIAAKNLRDVPRQAKGAVGAAFAASLAWPVRSPLWVDSVEKLAGSGRLDTA